MLVVNQNTTHLESLRWFHKFIETSHPPFNMKTVKRLENEDAIVIIGKKEIEDGSVTLEDIQFALTNQHDASVGKSRKDVKS